MKKVFITTPIYYANGAPHVGNAYASIIADTIARLKRMAGYKVKFSTGTDENGQKMTQKAALAGKDVMTFLNEIAAVHQDTWDTLQISYTDFIRTTSDEHHELVKEVLQKTFDKGDIYQDAYEGLYCIGCEAFKKETDLVDYEGKKVCPDHLVEPQAIKENNWFFRLSRYQDALLAWYQQYPEFAMPSYRFNEVISFVEQGLEDFSISREGSSFGITLPFDPKSVTYIRFDALYNYVTVCAKRNTLSKGETDMEYRNDAEVIHVIGKEIARFHAIYRPAMLMSAEFKLPDTVLIHGFFTVDGQKMSKSLGNSIDPVQCVQEHGRDALVYYLLSDIKLGNDGDFSRARFGETKENVLKKGWGNLVSRVVKLAQKFEIAQVNVTGETLERMIKVASAEGLDDNRLWKACLTGGAGEQIDGYLETFDVMTLVRDWFELVQLGNKYIDVTQPRVSGKDDPERAKSDLEVLLWLIKNSGLISSAFLLESFEKLKTIVHVEDERRETFSTQETTTIEDLIALKSFGVSYGEGYLY